MKAEARGGAVVSVTAQSTTSALVSFSGDSGLRESGPSVGPPYTCLKTGVLGRADLLGGATLF